MAGSDSKPLVFKDFTRGLYERGNDRECPPNGLLECTDCYPLPEGGLRAAQAWTEVGPIGTSQVALGLHVNELSAVSSASQGYIVSQGYSSAGSSLQAKHLWYSSQATTAAFSTIYALTTAGSGTLAYMPAPFCDYLSTVVGLTNLRGYVLSGLAASTAAGLISLLGTSASVVSTQQSQDHFIGVHQSRIMTGFNQNSIASILYTEPGGVAFPSTNVLQFGDYGSNSVASFGSIYASDLVAVMKTEGVTLIQGEIVSPLVRQIDRYNAAREIGWGCITPLGFAYLTKDQGVWVANGDQAVHLSPQFVGTPMTTETFTEAKTVGFNSFLGSVGFLDGRLYTPTGYIFDDRVKAWYRSTLPSSRTYRFWSAYPTAGLVFGLGNDATGGMYLAYASTDEATMSRATSYAMTLPLFDLDERNVSVREIEIHGQGFGNGGTFTLTLTPTPAAGQPAAATMAAGAGVVRFNTAINSSTVKLRIQSAGTSGSEAPMIERVVVSLQPKQKRSE